MGSKKYTEYEISCANCNEYVLKYHKYGSGKGIIRLYCHRIQGPTKLVASIQNGLSIKAKLPPLTCTNCGTLLGIPKTYDNGKIAFQMRKSFFHRKKIK